MTPTKKLFLSASVIALSIGSTASIAHAQCSGIQTRTIECLDYRGNLAPDERYCTDHSDVLGEKPGPPQQTCPISCGSGTGSGSGGNSGGSQDDSGDGVSDTQS